MTNPRLVRPNHLSLGELIARLKEEDPATRLPIGFHRPHSYRGYYEDLAFEVASSITVGDMLKAAESAVGQTYHGWKGGEYAMSDYTSVWLVTEPGDCGESIGAVFLEFLLAHRETTLED